MMDVYLALIFILSLAIGFIPVVLSMVMLDGTKENVVKRAFYVIITKIKTMISSSSNIEESIHGMVKSIDESKNNEETGTT